MNPDFWRQRRVFITGHTGFCGSWLTEWFTHLGVSHAGYSLPDDIRDSIPLADRLLEYAPDVVIHLAAQSLVGEGYESPLYTFDVNARGTASILEVCRTYARAGAILIATSDKCYSRTPHPAVVGWPLGGVDPYSASKACAEHIAWAYARSYAMPVATARAGNVIGGGDISHNRLIPDIIRAKRAGKPIILRYPSAIRPWQHVLDCLNGYLILCEQLFASPPSYAGPFNFGPHGDDPAKTVLDVVKYFDCEYVVEKAQHPENPTLLLDTSQTLARLPWKPKLRGMVALEWTRTGYFDKLAHKRAQIKEWMAL